MYVSSNQILVRLFEGQGETFIRTNCKIKKRKPHFEYNIFFNLFDNRRDVDLIGILDVFYDDGFYVMKAINAHKLSESSEGNNGCENVVQQLAAIFEFIRKKSYCADILNQCFWRFLLCLGSYDPSNIFACPQLLETYHMMMEYAPAKPVKNMPEINPFRKGGWNIFRKMNIWSRSEASRENMKFLGQSLS